MKKLTPRLLAGSLLAICLAAQAQEDCSKKTISWAVDECRENNKVATEKVLNAEYQAAKNRIVEQYSYDNNVVKKQLQMLLDTQRNWLKYRKGQCEMEASLAEEGSSAHSGFINECINKLDKQRIVQFKEIPYG
ncbi:lysozyme inhibitor LprI family protein [Erwinia psidii]|uniref:DUF1311 domain-containing protein n=1 Tax=Erwinia psidii TaxID=69224 RepID=A0A3N6S754_9GAMM|nr:lysozyme inhibitor LprI family protein [Erwinia psidii]MCX8959403.1 DUF1311 domain-containing protein [Erwinia psidii]MCX8962659.1 DUF1311 domain-containing protein [Erwinia psidii]MCX8964255.1 DUF1311 domain-containing protein [Erwinia psidii]RQM36910.1 DUF1311 domain-containing protein [Erwinia psidii]